MLAPRAGRFLGPVALLLAATVLLGWIGYVPLVLGVGLAVVLLAAFAFLLVFFRDPDRPLGAGIVSAADGRVRAVETQGDRLLVSVFMNVYDVHVNRFPVDGRVVGLERSGDGYRAAFRADADRNVRCRYRLESPLGEVDVVQITGLVARRLVPFVDAGSVAVKGARLGMIVLGSRVDVWLPAARVEPAVRVGERVRAGVTTIAREVR